MSLSPDLLPEPEPTPETAAAPAPQPRRIPNLGHALLFVAVAGVLLLAAQVILILFHKQPVDMRGGSITIPHPVLQLASMVGIYALTLLFAWLVFPLLWHRPFLDGLQWRWSTASGHASRLLILGFALSATVAVLTAFANSPKNLPMDEFFLKPSTAWLVTLFGIFVAPPVEEICFRGFLFPAFAIAYDWIALPRTPEARNRWHSTTALTPASLLFSAVVTSVCFAMLHAQQEEHFWVALLSLFCVSLVLCWVRARTQSVAASTLVHASYNALLFLGTIIATGGYRHLDRLTH